MGSRIKSMFFGRSSNNNNNVNLQAAKPYDSIVALDPPVKGSYPVAGNGPNVLEEIQRMRAKRQSTAASIAAPPPNVPRRREDAAQRPRTAPHDGTPGGGHSSSKSAKSTKGRTLSGFSMKSPPSVFSSSSRRNPVRSTIDRPPLPPNPNPSTPQVYSPPPPREIKTYIPTNGTTNVNTSTGFTPPFAQQHNRTSSQASHKSYVDLLDAHSNIKRTREASLHRTKASGVRNYGEDVADRNIADFGERSERDPKLDLNSPEFSYLKSVYAPKKRIVRAEPHSRVGSALGHVLGTDGTGGDDTQPSTGQAQPRTNSMRSTTSARSGPRPTSIYPPRVDSASAAALSYGNVRSRDDHRSTPPNGPADRRGRALSPLSSAAASISEEPPARDYRSRQSVNSTRVLSTPPVPERGRTRPITITTTTTTTSTTSTHRSNPPPVSAPGKVTSPPHSRQASGTRAGEATSSKTKRRSMSTTSQSTVVPPTTNGGTSSRKGPVSYSAFLGAPEPGQISSLPPTANATKRQGMIVEGASQPPSLEGIVDLRNSVDTDVTTKILPAVVHEHVTPTRHEIRQEVITREIHNHDVYHRILPVIETEILPTKHYVKGQDGKTLVEIPESMVPKHTVTGKLDQNWHISKPGPSRLANGIEDCETASRASTDSAPDGPVIGLARGEPRSRPRGNSKASSLTSNKNREPILSSKKESITKDGIPKTEYVWRHPPVFETATGQTQPMYIGAGIGDLSGENYYSDEDDELGAEFGAARSTAKGEEGLLFRDSGYGSGGMLPGLAEKSPAANRNSNAQLGRVIDSEPIGKAKSAPTWEGEATKALRRMRERRRSSAASKTNGVDGLENGVKNMSVKQGLV